MSPRALLYTRVGNLSRCSRYKSICQNQAGSLSHNFGLPSDSIVEFHIVSKQVRSTAEVVHNVIDVNQENDGADNAALWDTTDNCFPCGLQTINNHSVYVP